MGELFERVVKVCEVVKGLAVNHLALLDEIVAKFEQRMNQLR